MDPDVISRDAQGLAEAAAAQIRFLLGIKADYKGKKNFLDAINELESLNRSIVTYARAISTNPSNREQYISQLKDAVEKHKEIRTILRSSLFQERHRSFLANQTTVIICYCEELVKEFSS